MSKNIIFVDLDGTLLDGVDRQHSCYSDIVRRGGGTPIEKDKYWNLKRNKVNRKEQLQLSNYKESYDIFLSQWLENIEQPEYLKLDTLKPFVKETLEKWSLEYIIILVTMRQSYENLIVQLKELEIFRYFDDIYCCDYRIANTKYNEIKQVHFDRAVFIGDTEEDMLTAERLNIPFLAIETGIREKSYFTTPNIYKELNEIEIEKFFRE